MHSITHTGSLSKVILAILLIYFYIEDIATKTKNIYLGIYSVVGASLTIYYAFNREQIKIKKDKDDDQGTYFCNNYTLL